MSSRLPFNYRRVPAPIRGLAATLIGRCQRGHADRWASFPAWPLDLSADFVADAAVGETAPRAAGPAPVVLTHDIDSAEGLANLVARFLPIEESVGAHSTNFVVARGWPLDHGLLTEVVGRAHALGIHGYDHGNRTPFCAPETRRARLDAAIPLIERYRIEGYRAPSLLRTRALLRDLGRLYRWDSSIPTSGGLFPVPNNGWASARPFLVEELMELPVSMPRDGSLRFLGHDAAAILEMWIACAETISRSRGVVVLLTHCEDRSSGDPAMLETYRAFLERIAVSDHFAWSTPGEVLRRSFPSGQRGGPAP